MRTQAYVLTLVADGQAELVIGHRHTAALGFAGQQFHLDHLGRRQRSRDKLGHILAPADDVDLLAAQFLHDLFHTGTAGTDAGAHRVDVGVLAPDGQLGAGTGFAGNGLDLDGAVVDFGHFQFKHPLDQAGMGAADGHTRATVGSQNIHHVDLHGLALVEFLTGDLLIAGQNGTAALAQIQHHVAAFRINGNHRSHNKLMSTGLHLAALQVAFAFPQALTDHVLGRLGSDATEFLRFELGDHALTYPVALADLLSILQTDLGVGVLHFLDDLAQKAGTERTDLGVDIHDHVLVLNLIVLLDSDHNGRLDLVDQVIFRQAALFFEGSQSVKEFVVSSSHFYGFLPI